MFNIDMFPNVTPGRTRTATPLNRFIQGLNSNVDTSVNSVQDSCTDDEILQVAFFVEFNIGVSETKEILVISFNRSFFNRKNI